MESLLSAGHWGFSVCLSHEGSDRMCMGAYGVAFGIDLWRINARFQTKGRVASWCFATCSQVELGCSSDEAFPA